MKHDLNWLISRPIAHRGLHDGINKLENSVSAATAAIENGLNIELDMQTVRGAKESPVPVIFHDYELNRLTGEKGNIRDLSQSQLSNFKLGGSNDIIPTLDELLASVSGQTGILLELKGHKGNDDGFAQSVAECLSSYNGPVALMSFNHWLVEDLKIYAPNLPVGLTAYGDDKNYQLHKEFISLCDVDFVSYDIRELPCKFATEFRNSGKPLISWTIKTLEQAREAMKHSDQMTFEGFDPSKI